MDLRDFANHLGLSIATVSRALNGYPDVSAKTRQRVLAAAKQLNYSPNPAGRSLRTRTSDTIGFLLSPPQTDFANPFFLQLLVGIDEELRDTQFQLVVTAAPTLDDELPRLMHLVEKQRVDAMILSRPHHDDRRINYLLEQGIPFAVLGSTKQRKRYAYIDLDHKHVGYQACIRFAALGHRRIAALNTLPYLNYSRDFVAGYRAALRDAGLEPDPKLIVAEDMNEEGGMRGTQKLLAMPDPPTAIICGHDLLALGAIRCLERMGKRAGEVGVIGCDNVPLGAYIKPSLTTFGVPVEEIGRKLTGFLLSSMSGGDLGQLQEVMKPTLIVRESDGREVSRRRARR